MVGYDDQQKELSPTQYALAGAVSGITTRLLLQPLDVVKIRLQLQVDPLKQVEDIRYRKHSLLWACYKSDVFYRWDLSNIVESTEAYSNPWVELHQKRVFLHYGMFKVYSHFTIGVFSVVHTELLLSSCLCKALSNQVAWA